MSDRTIDLGVNTKLESFDTREISVLCDVDARSIDDVEILEENFRNFPSAVDVFSNSAFI